MLNWLKDLLRRNPPTTDKNVSMPAAWNNAKGWEEYYASRYLRSDFFDSSDRPGSIPINAYPQLTMIYYRMMEKMFGCQVAFFSYP